MIINEDAKFGTAVATLDKNKLVVGWSEEKYSALNSLGKELEFTEKELEDEMDRLQIEYDALSWKRSRQAEFPSIQDLVVALYDTDDKSAVEAKRAAVKAKYPKPS